MSDPNTSEPQYSYQPTSPGELLLEQGAYGERFSSCGGPQSSALVCLGEEQVVQPKTVLEVILWGKTHLVTPEEFQAKASKYMEALRMELLTQQDYIISCRQIYLEWAQPDGLIAGLTASTVSGASQVADWFRSIKKAPKPDPAEFQKLVERLGTLAERFVNPKPVLVWPNIHFIGEHLCIIREDHKRLNHQVEQFRNHALDTAEGITKGLEMTESASFQMLALVPTITMMDPFREAAYKIFLLVVRAGARSGGAALAETSVVRELCGVLKSDVPPLVVDLVTLPLTRNPAFRAKSNILRETILWGLQQVVEGVCDLVILVSEKGKDISHDDLENLLMNRLTSTVAKVVSLFLGGSAVDTNTMKWIKSSIESTINTLWRDMLAAKDRAAAEKREFWDVFLSDIGWTILKIVQGTFMGVMQRQAQTYGHVSAHDDVQKEQHMNFVRDQKVSSILATPKTQITSKRERRIRNKIPLPAMRPEEMAHWQSETNLRPDLAAQLRRYTHDFNEIVTFRAINKAMAKHMGDFSKRPKPLFVKSKSADMGENQGLVVRPIEGVTHSAERIRVARECWEKSVEDLKKNHCWVRDDGVVFHPDMLIDWAHYNPADKAVAQKAREILQKAQAANPDHFDLTESATSQWLAQHYPEDMPAVLALVARAKIGFYSDIDVSENVDASTGQRKVLGDGSKETTKSELAYARRNQDNVDQEVNVNSDFKNIPVEHRGPDGRALILDPNKNPHHHNFIQHGGDYEYYAGGPGGTIVMVFPGGTFLIVKSRLSLASEEAAADRLENAEARHDRHEEIQKKHNADIREQYEAALKNYLKNKYQPTEDRVANLRKDTTKDLVNWADNGGKGERIRTEDLKWRKYYYHEQRRDPVGRCKLPVPDKDILAGMLYRGLDMTPVGLASLMPSPNDQDKWAKTLDEQHVFVAIDTPRKNLVVYTSAGDSMGDALARLGRVVSILELDRQGKVVLWFEIYTHFKPVTTNFILNRIGGATTGIVAEMTNLKSLVSSMGGDEDKQLFAFRVDGFHESFSSEPEDTYDGEGIKVEGLKLLDVWETTSTRELSEAPTQITGKQVTVYNTTLVTCPASMDPHEVWGKAKKKPVPEAFLPSTEDVVLLQEYLVGKRTGLLHCGYDLGSSGPDGDGVDGACGAKTTAAIRQFQIACGGLKDDGIYGSKTRAALDKELNG